MTKTLTRCTAADIGITAKNETDAKTLSALNDYLSVFIAPTLDESGDPLCHNCGALLGSLFGSFVWGIVGGEGYCGRCKSPMRAYHRTIIGTFGFLLAYFDVEPDNRKDDDGDDDDDDD